MNETNSEHRSYLGKIASFKAIADLGLGIKSGDPVIILPEQSSIHEFAVLQQNEQIGAVKIKKVPAYLVIMPAGKKDVLKQFILQQQKQSALVG